MPQLSGLEVAARLLARRQLPILLVSGFIDECDIAAARELGLRTPLRRPVEPEQLRSALESALGEAEQRDDG